MEVKKYSKIDKKIEEILGAEVSRVCIQSCCYLGTGKRFHIDVLAKNEDEAMRILNENKEKLEKVYLLFGERIGNFRIWGSYPYRPPEKRSLLERLVTKIFDP